MNKISIALVLFGTLFMTSCRDVFEENIEEDYVNILAPENKKHLNTRNVTFVWNELEGAEDYHIEIVTPRFTDIESIVLDTVLDGEETSMEYTLPYVGEYEWKIYAVNGAYESQEVIRIIYVDSITFGAESVILISPVDGYITNASIVKLDWEDFSDAASYSLEIANPDFTTGTIDSISSGSSSYNYSFANEGSYEWRVRAYDANGAPSLYSDTRSLEIDFTAPTAPVADSAAVDTANVTLYWTDNTSASDINFDSVYVAKDSLFTDIVQQSTSMIEEITFTGMDTSTYYWKVKSIDVAGNSSDDSNVKSFIIN